MDKNVILKCGKYFKKVLSVVVDWVWYASFLLWLYLAFYPFIRMNQTGRFELLTMHAQPILNAVSLLSELLAVYTGMLCLFFMAYSFLRLIKNFLNARIFESRNVFYVKMFGLSIFSFGLMPLFMSLGQSISRFIASPVRLTHDAQLIELLDIRFIALLAVGLIVFSLSAVFKKGVDLKHDSILTI